MPFVRILVLSQMMHMDLICSSSTSSSCICNLIIDIFVWLCSIVFQKTKLWHHRHNWSEAGLEGWNYETLILENLLGTVLVHKWYLPIFVVRMSNMFSLLSQNVHENSPVNLQVTNMSSRHLLLHCLVWIDSDAYSVGRISYISRDQGVCNVKLIPLTLMMGVYGGLCSSYTRVYPKVPGQYL